MTRWRKNLEYLASRGQDYPYQVVTQKGTAQDPDPKRVTIRELLRVPLEETVVWGFKTEEDADAFRAMFLVPR